AMVAEVRDLDPTTHAKGSMSSGEFVHIKRLAAGRSLAVESLAIPGGFSDRKGHDFRGLLRLLFFAALRCWSNLMIGACRRRCSHRSGNQSSKSDRIQYEFVCAFHSIAQSYSDRIDYI